MFSRSFTFLFNLLSLAKTFKLQTALILCFVFGVGLLAQAAGPTAMSLAQASGTTATGAPRRLTITYNDPDGGLDLDLMRIQVNSTQSNVGGLSAYYNSGQQKLYMLADDGATPLGGYAPGSNNVITNSQGSLNCADITVTTGGPSAVITWNFTPSASFTGAKLIHGFCRDASVAKGWDYLGDWTIVPNVAPINLSASPTSGSSNSGASRPLTVTYRDVNGQSTIRQMKVLINGTTALANSLCAMYDRGENKLYLLDDAGNQSGQGFAPGTNNVLSNSQGRLNCATTTVTSGGNETTIVWGFTPLGYLRPSGGSFYGPKNIYAFCTDASGVSKGWDDLGDWTINQIPATSPKVTLINPSDHMSYTKEATTISMKCNDANGRYDIKGMYFQAYGPAGENYGQLGGYFDVTLNKLYLATNGVWGSTGYAPGSPNVISGPLGSLDCANTTVTYGLDYVNVNWRFIPKYPFVGNMETSGNVESTGGDTDDGMGAEGTWEINLSVPDVPTILSLTRSPTNQLTVTWSHVYDASSYTIFNARSTSPLNFNDWDTVQGHQSHSLIKAGQPGLTYTFAVEAENATSSSDRSSTVSIDTAPVTAANLLATPSDGTVTLTWTKSSGATGYKVFMATTSNGYGAATPVTIQDVPGDNTKAMATIPGLPNGQIRYFVVKATRNGADSPNSSEVFATPAALPSAPGTLTAVGTTGGINLSWVAATGSVDKYQVYRKSGTGNYAPLGTPQTALTISDTSAATTGTGGNQGTAFTYQVKAVNINGQEGTGSNEATATSLAVPSTSFGATAGQITLNWAAVPGAIGYQVFMRTGTAAYNYAAPLTPTATLSYTQPNPVPGTTYSYQVRATAPNSQSNLSTEVSKTLPPTQTPSGLTANAGTNAVTLTWNWTGTGTPAFRLYRKKGTEAYQIVSNNATSGMTDEPAAPNQLVNGTLYSYYVVAYYSAGGGDGPASNTATATPIDKVINVQAVPNNLKAKLSWSATAGAVDYVVERFSGSGPWVQLTGPFTSAPTVGNPYQDTGLNNGTAYKYRVRGRNTIGLGTWSDEITTTPVAPPGPPTALNATIGTSVVNLSWPQVNGATGGYRVYRKEGAQPYDAGRLVTPATQTTTTFSDSGVGLTNGVTYTYMVRALDSYGQESADSPVRNATPVAAPTPLTATGGPGKVTLNWSTSVPGATFYRIYRSETAGALGALVKETASGTGSSTSYVDDDISLVPGTTYYYVVRAANADGESSNSMQTSGIPSSLTRQVDLLVGNGTTMSGDDFYFPDVDNQTFEGTTQTGALTYAYKVTVQNEGSTLEEFRLSGRGNSSGWKVEYFDQWVGGTSISSDVKSSNYLFDLASGASHDFRVEVTVLPLAQPNPAPGDQKEVPIAVSSEANSSVGDKVVALTTHTSAPPSPTAPTYLVDAAIRVSTEGTYVGENVYATSSPGTNQSKAANASSSQAATFDWKIFNRGSAADTFKITIQPQPNWTIRVYDALEGGTERSTLALSSSGFVTESVSPGQSTSLRVEVQPSGGATGSAAVLITAASMSALDAGDSTKKDVAKITATVGTTTQPAIGVFSGSTLACAGGVDNNVHKLNLALHVTQNGINVPAGTQVIFSLEDNVGHNFGTTTSPITPNPAKIYDPVSETWQSTITRTTSGTGDITDIKVLSSDRISQPRLVARIGTSTIGAVRCQFSEAVSKRNEPDPALGTNPTGWEAYDTGWSCNLSELDEPGKVVTGTVAMKFKISEVNFQPVPGHQLKVGFHSVVLKDESVIQDKDEVKKYLTFVDDLNNEISNPVVTTQADGKASFRLKAKDGMDVVKSVFFAAIDTSQWDK